MSRVYREAVAETLFLGLLCGVFVAGVLIPLIALAALCDWLGFT